MLYLEHVNKKYNKFLAVNNLSLRIPEGDLFGFVGPNGAGKTTSIRMICGLLKPTSGKIQVNGLDISNNLNEVKKCIGYVPDFFGVYNNLKVSEYLEFYGSIYGLDDRSMKKLTGELLELVNLKGKEDVYVDTLSRGMKQRLCVARVLIHNPKLLVMDEPSSGLDPRARVEMKELLMNLNDMGKTIIISSHILSDIAEMCNSIGIMNLGILKAVGRMEDVLSLGTNKNNVYIDIVGNTDLAVSVLQPIPFVRIVSLRQNELVTSVEGTDREVMQMINALISSGVIIRGFHREENNLETLFMKITGGGAPGAAVKPNN